MNVKILFLILFFYGSVVSAQQNKDSVLSGQAYGTVHANFNSSLNSNNAAFDVSRAYFGYKRDLSKEFSANVKLDLGQTDERFTQGIERYVFFKNANLTYKKKSFTLNAGLIDLAQFKTQEKYWDYRYVYKSFQDANKLGTSADFGILGEYKINKYFITDLSISNGEGYKSVQNDGAFKVAGGLTITPTNSLIIRVYYDYLERHFIQQTFSGFLGYELMKKFKVGLEYSEQINNDGLYDHNFGGYSLYLLAKINQKLEAVLRYDRLASKKLDNDNFGWNRGNDGKLYLGGIQYRLQDNIRTSLNFQILDNEIPEQDKKMYMFLNLEFCF